MSTKLVQSDRTPFWGHKTVAEFKYLQQILNNKHSEVSNFNRQCFRELLKSIYIFKRIKFFISNILIEKISKR